MFMRASAAALMQIFVSMVVLMAAFAIMLVLMAVFVLVSMTVRMLVLMAMRMFVFVFHFTLRWARRASGPLYLMLDRRQPLFEIGVPTF